MSDKTEFSKLIADVREQVLYMQELGIEALAAELPEIAAIEQVRSVAPSASIAAVSPVVESEPNAPPPDIDFSKRAVPQKSVEKKAAGSRLAAMPSLSRRKPPVALKSGTQNVSDRTEKMAVETQNEGDRDSLGHSGTDGTDGTAGQRDTSGHGTGTGRMEAIQPAVTDTIESIRAEIGDCTRCPLYTGRTQIVHSTGNFNADLVFVGEAPGADEDAQGVPFIGRAGQLLTKIIESIGMNREEVFIGNINRCRPPGNRQPLPDEAATCRPFLLREIAVVKPKVIVVLGAHAAHNLLQVKTPISKLRGQFHDYFGVKVMPTFHPAYLLRDPHKKREVWEDMKKVREYLNGQ